MHTGHPSGRTLCQDMGGGNVCGWGGWGVMVWGNGVWVSLERDDATRLSTHGGQDKGGGCLAARMHGVGDGMAAMCCMDAWMHQSTSVARKQWGMQPCTPASSSPPPACTPAPVALAAAVVAAGAAAVASAAPPAAAAAAFRPTQWHPAPSAAAEACGRCCCIRRAAAARVLLDAAAAGDSQAGLLTCVTQPNAAPQGVIGMEGGRAELRPSPCTNLCCSRPRRYQHVAARARRCPGVRLHAAGSGRRRGGARQTAHPLRHACPHGAAGGLGRVAMPRLVRSRVGGSRDVCSWWWCGGPCAPRVAMVQGG